MKRDQSEREVLLLPFMQMASGHHQVADTLAKELTHSSMTFNCQKVDILSYRFGAMERLIASTYLSWIKRLPSTYHWLYEHLVYKQKNCPHEHRYYLYETLFLPYFKKLIEERQPTLLFFTHSLPSYIASVLKQKGQLDALTINVYTDFFVNHLWGIKGIDFHFVPTTAVKAYLMNLGVPEKRIMVTGIPVDRTFKQSAPNQQKDKQLSMLVMGGHLGVGGIESLIKNLLSSDRVHYHVLCGKNDSLYQTLVELNKAHLTPYPFIDCREKMNELYDQVDGVLTKAGGVTISECLVKRKPIFVYQPLPGQEQINIYYLKKLGLIQVVDLNRSVEKQILNYFNDPYQLQAYQHQLELFQQQLENRPLASIIDELATNYL